MPGFRVLGIPAVVFGKLLRKHVVLRAVSCGEVSGAFFRTDTWARFLVNIYLWIRKHVLQHADQFICVSSAIKQELEAGGIPLSKINVIPNGVDTTIFKPLSSHEKSALRKRLTLPADRRVLVYTGRLVRYKGVQLLLNVWKEMAQDYPEWDLVVVGTGGTDIDNCEDELKQFVTDHHLEKRVMFTGGVNNVYEYLQAGDVFVFPSENESFGISVIEAMACGIPVVSSSAGGLSDLIEHEVNGLSFTAGDGDALKTQLMKMMSERVDAEGMVSAALESVATHYAQEVVAKAYQELFEGMSGNSGVILDGLEAKNNQG